MLLSAAFVSMSFSRSPVHSRQSHFGVKTQVSLLFPSNSSDLCKVPHLHIFQGMSSGLPHKHGYHHAGPAGYPCHGAAQTACTSPSARHPGPAGPCHSLWALLSLHTHSLLPLLTHLMPWGSSVVGGWLLKWIRLSPSPCIWHYARQLRPRVCFMPLES